MIYIFSIAGALLGFALNILLARVLSLADLDKIKYLVALTTTLSNIFVVGLPSFIVREVNRPEQAKDFMSKCYSFFFFISLFIIPIVYYALNNETVYTKDNPGLSFLVMGVSILMGVVSLVASFFLGTKRFKSYYTIEIIFPKAIIILLCSIFVIAGLSTKISNFYLLFYLIVYLLIDAFFLIKQFRSFTIHFNSREIVSIMVFFGTTITQVLVSSLSTILQSNMFPTIIGVTSTISTAALLMSVVNVFTNVLSSIIKPFFAKHYIEKNDDKIVDYYRFGTRTNLYFAIPVYLFFIIFPKKFLMVFSSNLLIYPNILSIVALTQLLSSLCGTTGALLSMIGEERKQLINVAIQFFVFATSVFILRKESVYGIVISTLISEIFVTVIKFFEVGIKYKQSPLDGKTIVSILLIIATNCGMILVFSFLQIDNLIIWFLLAIPIGIILLVLNILLTPYGKKDFNRLIHFKEEK